MNDSPEKGRSFHQPSCWRWRLLSLLWLALAVPLPGHASQVAAPTFGPTPGWVVRDPVPDPSSSGLGSDGSRYLLVADQVDLGSARPEWHRRIVYTVEHERGLTAAGQFRIEFQPAYQRVVIHEVLVTRDKVNRDARHDVDIQLLRRESGLESSILDGRHTAHVTIPDLRVGDQVDYSYSVIGANPVFGDAYYDLYTARYSEPLGRRIVRVTYPSARAVRWRTPGKPFSVQESRLGSSRRVEIRADELPRFKEEENTPPDYDPYGRIEISTADGWGAISAWADPLYDIGLQDRELAERLIGELRLHEGDDDARLDRAIRYVQGQIRYTALDLGHNSHAPYAPETVLRRRYGDCKDKSVLLVALLREAGLEADPVLVSTQLHGAVERRLPSALAFDHVVTRVRLRGRTIWVDATRDSEAGELRYREPLPFKLGLPVCRDCDELVPIPDPMPILPVVDVGERIDLHVSGDQVTADFVVVTDYASQQARDIRANFDESGAEAVGKQYLKYMRNFYDGIKDVGVPSVDEHRQAGLRTTEKYRLAWSKVESSSFGIVAFQLLDWVPAPKEDSRRDPFALAGPRHARQSIRTSLDGGWSIAPEHARVENPYFSFTRDVRVEGKSLVITAEWKRKASQVPAKAFPSVKEDLQKVRDLLQFDVDLDPMLSTWFSSSRAWMVPLVAFGLLAASLWGAWRVRRSSRLAGMLFLPGRTIDDVLATASAGPTACLALASVSLTVAIDHGSELAHEPNAYHYGVAAGALLGYLLHFLLAAGLIQWAFRLFSRPLPYRHVLKTTIWSSSPATIVFFGFAILAVSGRVAKFAENYAPVPGDGPGLVAAGLIAVIGAVWAFCCSIGAYAGLASVSRRFAFGTVCLAAIIGIFVLALLALPFFLAMRLA